MKFNVVYFGPDLFGPRFNYIEQEMDPQGRWDCMFWYWEMKYPVNCDGLAVCCWRIKWK